KGESSLEAELSRGLHAHAYRQYSSRIALESHRTSNPGLNSRAISSAMALASDRVVLDVRIARCPAVRRAQGEARTRSGTYRLRFSRSGPCMLPEKSDGPA